MYRDGSNVSGTLGDVDTYDDTTAAAPVITAGSAVATDGTYLDKVALSLTGNSISDGTTHTYTVYAYNAAGWSSASAGDTGYRVAGTLTYQWYKSAGDSDASYSAISGATTSSYDDTGTPAGGFGRYFKCVESSSGATSAASSADRGYRQKIFVPIINFI